MCPSLLPRDRHGKLNKVIGGRREEQEERGRKYKKEMNIMLCS